MCCKGKGIHAKDYYIPLYVAQKNYRKPQGQYNLYFYDSRK